MNFKNRIYSHFNNGHLPKDCYDGLNKIKYAELNSKTEMDIYELYYINKYNPIFNTANKNNDIIDINLKELDWITYDWRQYILRNAQSANDAKNIRVKVEMLNTECEQLQEYKNRLEKEVDILEIKKNKLTNIVDKLLENTNHNSSYNTTNNTTENIALNISPWQTINIYKFSNLKNLTFSAQLHQNKKLIGDYAIYRDDDNIYLKNKIGGLNPRIIYNFTDDRKFPAFELGLCISYVPDQDITIDLYNLYNNGQL